MGGSLLWRTDLAQVDDDLKSQYQRAQQAQLTFSLKVADKGTVGAGLLRTPPRPIKTLYDSERYRINNSAPYLHDCGILGCGSCPADSCYRPVLRAQHKLLVCTHTLAHSRWRACCTTSHSSKGRRRSPWRSPPPLTPGTAPWT